MPQNPCNKLSLVVYACDPRAGEAETGESLQLAGPLVSSLKKKKSGQCEALSQKQGGANRMAQWVKGSRLPPSLRT